MQRYFGNINDGKVILCDEDIHHISHVMRMKKGDQFELVSQGQLYLCQIANCAPLSADVICPINSDTELDEYVTLFFPLAKGDKIDFMIQKASELGVRRIVLFASQRCVVNLSQNDFEKKLNRYQKIAKEASEQCHRLYIPEIKGIIRLSNIPEEFLSDINLLAYEKKAGSIENAFENLKGKSISYIVGPEGGFSEDEVNTLAKAGFLPISLGKRILRVETAGVYGLSVVAYNLEK